MNAQRHFAFYLPCRPYHRSPIEITAERYSTFRHRLEEKGRKKRKYIYMYSPLFPFPSVNDEFAYKMKECPPRIEDRVYFYSETCFSFFLPARCICIFLDLRMQRMAGPSSPYTSEFLIPKMHRGRYEHVFSTNFYAFHKFPTPFVGTEIRILHNVNQMYSLPV